MDNLTYKPFSAIRNGDCFHHAEQLNVLLMKTGAESAVLLQGYWKNGILHARGDVMNISKSTACAIPENTDLALPMSRVDPIDPARKFWKEGDTAMVGDSRRVPINVCAGLFLYSGFGSGTYYSSKENEVFFFGGDKAEAMAEAENIPLVHFDSMSWTNDPTLARERKDAKEVFDRKAKRKAEKAALATADAA